MTIKENIIKIVEEDLILLYETLYNCHRMKPVGLDYGNDKHTRDCREAFIGRAREDIEWQLFIRNKLITAEQNVTESIIDY